MAANFLVGVKRVAVAVVSVVLAVDDLVEDDLAPLA